MVGHNSILDDWRKNSSAHEDANYHYLRSLKFRDQEPVDALAAELHAQAFPIIDCTRCANCCKTLGVTFDACDIERIARHLGLEAADFIEKYMVRDEMGDLKMSAKPCSFLGEDNRCTIYEVRPTACRDYPNKHKGGFARRTYQHSANTLTCPAVYWIVEQMRKGGKWSR